MILLVVKTLPTVKYEEFIPNAINKFLLSSLLIIKGILIFSLIFKFLAPPIKVNSSKLIIGEA